MTPQAEEGRSGWTWPDALEGLVAAPQSHQMLFESTKFRVLEVIVKPGEREPRHTHRHPSVLIVHRAAPIRYYKENGQVIDIPGATPSSPVKAELMAPEEPHAVENVGSHDYHAFRIEFLDHPEIFPSQPI